MCKGNCPNLSCALTRSSMAYRLRTMQHPVVITDKTVRRALSVVLSQGWKRFAQPTHCVAWGALQAPVTLSQVNALIGTTSDHSLSSDTFKSVHVGIEAHLTPGGKWPAAAGSSSLSPTAQQCCRVSSVFHRQLRTHVQPKRLKLSPFCLLHLHHHVPWKQRYYAEQQAATSDQRTHNLQCHSRYAYLHQCVAKHGMQQPQCKARLSTIPNQRSGCCSNHRPNATTAPTSKAEWPQMPCAACRLSTICQVLIA